MRIRWLAYVFLVVVHLTGVQGCRHIYKLPGHSEGNLSPPDIEMEVGERREVLRNGFSLLVPGPAIECIQSDHPEIVEVTPEDGRGRYDWDKAYLHALRPGIATLRYSTGDWQRYRDLREFNVFVPEAADEG